MASTSIVAVPMNGGDGVYSYACNSSFQREAMESTKAIIRDSIAEKLDMENLLSFSTPFNIADLGCSIGPNAFIAVQNIIESVNIKYKSQNLNPISNIEYHVFFNDQTFNDFNTLFKSLPLDRQYFSAGVPGSFYGRLFPKGSLHFVHCSYSLQWMSKVPREVVEESSPAYNKGRIYYTNAPIEVFEAYSAQYAKDIQSFLDARTEEIVCGGLMALIVPCIPDGIAPSDCPLIAVADLLGACLMDMVNVGLVSETKVDSFNFPRYNPRPKELKYLIDTNGSFEIERMERLPRDTPRATAPTVQMLVLHLRAAWEGLIRKHFGSEIIDQLFDRVTEKFATSRPFSLSSSSNNIFELFLLLKRKYN